jgi:hypothetical protein
VSCGGDTVKLAVAEEMLGCCAAAIPVIAANKIAIRRARRIAESVWLVGCIEYSLHS